jgi:transposase
MESILGIDIARRKFDVALQVAGKFKYKSFSNDQSGFTALSSWLDGHGARSVHACLEATGSDGEALALWLVDASHRVSVVNPAQIKGFAQSLLARNKTDRVDSRIIALFCQAHQPPAWVPPPLEIRQLQAWVRRLVALQDLRQQEDNRLGTASAEVAASIHSVIAVLDREIAAVRQRIRDHFDQHPGLRQQRDLLDSIPGIGEATISSLLAFIGDIQRFSHAKQLAAFAGLTPRQVQSGSSVHGLTRITKAGNPLMRRALFMPAIVAVRHNPAIKAFYQRLRAAGKSGRSAIVACMRKLLHIVFGVLKSQQPFDLQKALALR